MVATDRIPSHTHQMLTPQKNGTLLKCLTELGG